VILGAAYRSNGGGEVAVRYNMEGLTVQAAQQLNHAHEGRVARGERPKKERALGALDLNGRSKDEGRVGLLDALNRFQRNLDESARYLPRLSQFFVAGEAPNVLLRRNRCGSDADT
jgi:hypothetical protein